MNKNSVLWKLRSRLRSRGNHYHIKGTKNKVLTKHTTLKACTFEIIGNNNTITFGEGSVAKHTRFSIHGTGCQIEIGANCYLGENTCLHIEDSDSYITIGSKTTVGEALLAVTEPRSKIEIGSECMIAHNIEIRTGDSHSILDLETDKRINYAKDIWIGNHVWVGAYAKILKGVCIQKDSIIGLGAIVTKNIPANSIAAGNPAKVIKKGITWCRERLYD